MRVVGEDVEDDGGAVDHRHAERRLEVPLLARHQLVVAGHQVGVAAGDLGLDLGQLSPPQVAVGVRLGAHLHLLPGSGDSSGSQKLLQLGQRVPVAGRGGHDPNRQGTLPCARVLDPGSPGPVAGLGGAALSGSLH
jgi:hypothetical protein